MLYFDDDAVINPQRANATHVSSKKTKEKKRYIRLKTDVNTGQRQIKQCCADQNAQVLNQHAITIIIHPRTPVYPSSVKVMLHKTKTR